MNAKEARAQAKLKNTSKKGGQMIEIAAVISAAVNKGEYECWWYTSMKDDVREELKKMGYKVGATLYDRNETLTKISW